jgi:hypothetical protein
VKKTLAVILIAAILCILCIAVIVPTAADGGDLTESPTLVTLPPVTPEPTTEPTTVPTTEPTTRPTTVPTTIPTTDPTTRPTTIPITEPTTDITITIEPTIGGGKGWIDVNCNEDGATVYFDGKSQGVTAGGILSVAVSPTGTPVQTITVSKAGYTTWSEPLSHMPADKEHVAVYATINPQPTTTITIPPVQTGTIYAQSNPAGAAIYLNGNLQGYSPITIPNLPPGTYSMKASLSGYTPDTQLINVYTGQTATYYPNLQQSPPAPRSTGTVSVTSTPNAALVYVDGNYQGKTPLTVTLYPGSHSFRLSIPGYNDYTASVYVTANTNQKLNAVMNTAIFGTVAISSMPGATVWMDSNSQGKIPSSGTLTLPGITSGNHVFKVTASGYNDWINTVYIQPNAVTPISATLTPSGGRPTPVQATGGFNIVSTPTGAEILIDNLFRGYTPSTLDGIAAGQHQVLLKYTGYIDYSTTATVNAGQTTPLAISMQFAPTPTPESSPSPVLMVGGLIVVLAIGASFRRRS